MELLTQLSCFKSTSSLEKCFELTENIQKFRWKGDWAKLRPKIYFLRQSYAKYLAQSKEIAQDSKTGQDFKNVISNFACFLTAIINV